jgi:plastocyanin
MRTIGVLASLAMLAGCGGGEKPQAAADTAQAAAPAGGGAMGGGTTHDVNMVLEGASSYKFVPAELTIKPGDRVVFHNVSGGPHNVAFWADSIPAGAKELLEPQIPNPIGPLSSELLQDPGATLALSFAGAPAGEYKFTCTPHMAMGMHGKITVAP